MVERIEFPLNFQRYLEMGREALVAEEFAEAELNFTKAYNLKADFEANRSLVESLVYQSKLNEALAIAGEMKDEYLANLASFKIYFRLLLGNGEFIQSWKLLLHIHLSQAEERELALEITQGEKIFQLYQQQELHELKKKRAQLAEATFFQQAQILKSWQKLPLADYLKVTKEVIEGSQLNLLLKNSLIADIVELNTTEEVMVTTLLGTKEKIKTSCLPLIEDQVSYQLALKALSKRVDNQDSELYQQLQEELRLHFTLLYPFADQLVTKPQLWVEVFLAFYLGSEIKQQEEQQVLVNDYRDLQEKIAIELSQMFLA